MECEVILDSQIGSVCSNPQHFSVTVIRRIIRYRIAGEVTITKLRERRCCRTTHIDCNIHAFRNIKNIDLGSKIKNENILLSIKTSRNRCFHLNPSTALRLYNCVSLRCSKALNFVCFADHGIFLTGEINGNSFNNTVIVVAEVVLISMYIVDRGNVKVTT